jgi:tetratricopeptide (TPR) repeat protein
MSAGAQRAALDAIHSARPIVARLSTARNSEDLAADIIEAWSAIETGLRSLLGGSALAGQNLIRELRTRHFLTFEQGNALAEFHAARERAARVDYKPTEGDVSAARDAFLKLEAGLMGEAAPAVPAASTTAATAAAAMPSDALGRRTNFTDAPPNVVPLESVGRARWVTPVLGVLGLVVVAAVVWYFVAGRSSGNAAYDAGVVAYREGRREAAASDFLKASHDAPTDPMPHVYLARMAREANNLVTANAEAVKAVQLGPTNGAALRELASASFAQQNYDVARTFYIRAIKADSSDRLSQGYLGCSLIRLGRIDEGTRWVQRAGTGSWTSCVPAPGTAAPGAGPAQSPVPMTVPR